MPLTISYSCTDSIISGSWSFPDDSCNFYGKKDILILEIGLAFDMANMASASFSIPDDPQGQRKFYNDFIAEADRNGKATPATMFHIYNRIGRMLATDLSTTDYDFTITCDDTTKGCSEKGFTAHMKDKDKRMNFCNSFFGDGDVGKAIVATEKARGVCIGPENALDLRGAQFTRSAILIHECTHTNHVMDSLGA